MLARAKRHPWQLTFALAILLALVALDLPMPWSTPLYYELAFDAEPWTGGDGLARARSDLERAGLRPASVEIVWTIGTGLACMGTGCNVSRALRATFTWSDVPAALERCFTYDPLRLSRTTAYTRDDCRALYTNADHPRY